MRFDLKENQISILFSQLYLFYKTTLSHHPHQTTMAKNENYLHLNLRCLWYFLEMSQYFSNENFT